MEKGIITPHYKQAEMLFTTTTTQFDDSYVYPILPLEFLATANYPSVT